MQGTVKWFNNDKGFGFIESEGKDYFVHWKEIKTVTDGYRSLNDGARVSFIGSQGAKGPCALEVKVEG